jgi:DNA-binding Lrp family transcriptional regulator
MRAYVLINGQASKVRDLATTVATLQGVRRARVCWGVPDIFVEVQIPGEQEFNDLLTRQIQKLDGVLRTETHIVVE